MPLNYAQKDRLKEIKESTGRQFLNKGYLLFQEGKVKLKFYDPEVDTFFFEVQGNEAPFYEVELCLYPPEDWAEFHDTDESCTCEAFSQYGECKHVAAATYFLLSRHRDKYPMGEAPLDFHNERAFYDVDLDDDEIWPTQDEVRIEKQQAFFSVACAIEELPGVVAQLPSKTVHNTYWNLLGTDLHEFGISYYVGWYATDVEIHLKYRDGTFTVEVTGSHSKNIDNAWQWLKSHLIRHGENNLALLTDQQRGEYAIRWLSSLGLERQFAEPYEVLQFDILEGEVIAIPRGELEGLYQCSSIKQLMEYKIGSFPDGEEGIADFAERDEGKEYGKYNAALLLCKSSDGKYTQLRAMMGKGSKKEPDALKVKLTYFNDAEDLRLSRNEGLEELFRLMDILSAKTEPQKKFPLFRELLLKSKNLYPLFTYDLGDWNYYSYSDTKITKMHVKGPLEVQASRLELRLSRNGAVYEMNSFVHTDEGAFPLTELIDNLLFHLYFVELKGERLFLFKTLKEVEVLRFLSELGVFRFVEKNKDEFFSDILLPISKNVTIMDKSGLLKETESQGQPQKQLYISELSGLVIFRPTLKYGPGAMSNPLEGNAIIDQDSQKIYLRDEDLEDEYIDWLRERHPSFKRGGGQGFFHLPYDAFMEDLWFMKTFEECKKNDVRLFGLEKMSIKKYHPFPPTIQMEFGSTKDWFEVKAEVAFGDNKVKLRDIKKALDQGRQFVELADGSLGILPEDWLKKFGRLFRSGENQKEAIKVAKTHFGLLDDIDEVQSFPKVQQEIAEKKKRLLDFQRIDQVSVPETLQASLRDYQMVGLNWLSFLQSYGWGGVLADDMGLGKTLQVISLICRLLEERKGAKVLVVAPTTLLFNWRNELMKFAPHLDYFIHHGNRYDSVEELMQHQVLLTSYGLVINDLELLSKVEFDLIVADESQAIKNTQSQRYKAITGLQGNFRLALTGTPIENSLVELYAQMNFVNPGFFMTLSGFKKNYLQALKKGDGDILQELRKKIDPFVLRRTKKEVLKELPDKTEEYLYCEMEEAQRKVYDAYRNEYRDFLLKKFEEEGAEKSKMYVLEGLTRLRQICDSTQLVGNAQGSHASAKIQLLMEHITEKTGNHKLLVFSQFVQMLDLVQQELTDRGVSYVYLDGKTSIKEREARVDRFQQDEGVRVFLISLKAGGTGLNLTAADYVYILDPWWNPAVENQAIDRCYRMGQEKHVIAYRMICKDTVEEKIMEMQQAKNKLAKEVIAEGDSFLGQLDRERMLELFEQ